MGNPNCHLPLGEALVALFSPPRVAAHMKQSRGGYLSSFLYNEGASDGPPHGCTPSGSNVTNRHLPVPDEELSCGRFFVVVGLICFSSLSFFNYFWAFSPNHYIIFVLGFTAAISVAISMALYKYDRISGKTGVMVLLAINLLVHHIASVFIGGLKAPNIAAPPVIGFQFASVLGGNRVFAGVAACYVFNIALLSFLETTGRLPASILDEDTEFFVRWAFTLTLLVLHGMMVVSVDRERKETEARLHSMADQAMQASQAKSIFLAVMSHEMRTPLNHVMIMTDLLEHELGPDGVDSALCEGDISAVWAARAERCTELLGTLRGSAKMLLDVVEDVLDLSKIESGKLELDARPNDLVALIDGMMANFAPNAKTKNLDIEFSAPGQVPLLMFDRLKVRRILTNLVGNAIKFTARGYVRVEVSPGKQPDTINVSVSDTGVGIGKDEMKRLFKPFSQAESTRTTRKYGGSGLGLVIAQQLARLMGGDLTVTSEKHVGSTFTFVMPAVLAPEGAVPEVPNAVEGDITSSPSRLASRRGSDTAAAGPLPSNSSITHGIQGKNQRPFDSRSKNVFDPNAPIAGGLLSPATTVIDREKPRGTDSPRLDRALKLYRESSFNAVSGGKNGSKHSPGDRAGNDDSSENETEDTLGRERNISSVTKNDVMGNGDMTTSANGDASRARALEDDIGNVAKGDVRTEGKPNADKVATSDGPLNGVEDDIVSVIKDAVRIEDRPYANKIASREVRVLEDNVVSSDVKSGAKEAGSTEGNGDSRLTNQTSAPQSELAERGPQASFAADSGSSRTIQGHAAGAGSAERHACEALRKFATTECDLMLGRSVSDEPESGAARKGREAKFVHRTASDSVFAKGRRSGASGGTSAAEGAKLKGCHVLVVDDNELNAKLTARLLQCLGARVTTMLDGVSAVDTVCNNPEGAFDAMLLDICMPEVDGFETARRIRAAEQKRKWRPLPIVALTAMTLTADRERALATGMHDFVGKPFNKVVLQEKILAAIETAKYRDHPQQQQPQT